MFLIPYLNSLSSTKIHHSNPNRRRLLPANGNRRSMVTDLQLRSTNSTIFLTTPAQNPCHSSNLFFARPMMRRHRHRQQRQRHRITTDAKKKKNPWLDAFDDGEDLEIEYDPSFSEGKQDEDERPPEDPTNPYGFLKFPPGHSVEIASLPLKIRGDVRRCCCVISGGVYENILFFPAIQLIKDRYPGVLIDVVTSPRGKQTYELNKNVRWANAYDPDDDFPEPMEYTDMIGLLKVDLSCKYSNHI